jgi:hypothetical protein
MKHSSKCIRSRDILQALAREARQYDILGQVPSIRYIPSVMPGSDVTPLDRGLWRCAHNIELDKHCTGCQRHSVDRFIYVGNNMVLFVPADTRVYIAAKLYRIKEVLKLLGMLP